MKETMEVQEVSLEKVIETKLIQNNVTEQVLSELKERYGNLKLKDIDDKESYLELKTAAKDCAKIRNLTTKVCKLGREDAVKVQKMWVAEEKRVIARISEVEEPLDAEIAKFDAEVDRKVREEKERQEEAYINRQAILTKMGATYSDGSFVLGDASFEAELIKSSSQDVWEEAIVPKFDEEYQKIEAVRIEEKRVKDEEAAEMKRQQDKLLQQQKELKDAQDEMQRQKDLADRIELDKRNLLQKKRFTEVSPYTNHGEKIEMMALVNYSEGEFYTILAGKKAAFEKDKADKETIAEAKRLKDIEDAKALAIQQEKQRLADIEVKRIADLEASKDKDKWESFINDVRALDTFEMRSGQYRNKMRIAKEKITEILSL